MDQPTQESMRLGVLVLTSMMLLAGCISPASDLEDTHAEAQALPVFAWTGQVLSAPQDTPLSNPPPFMERPPPPACEQDNCERMPFTIPADVSGDVLVGIEWEGQDETYENSNPPGEYLGTAAVGMDLRIYRDDQMIVDGEESFHYAAVATIPDPGPGEYIAEVVAKWGTSSYFGSVVAAPVTVTEGTLLPDLVMLPPDHLTITVPIGHDLDAVLGAATPGCGPDEIAEDQELRCLRFAGILGNQGPGDFETNLQYDEATASVTGQGYWEQRVYQADGSSETFPVAPAQYHAVHGHFHILDFVETTLYEYDEEEDARGADTGFGRKTGFCIIDGGLIDPMQPLAEPKYHGNGCCYLAGFCTLDMLSYPYFSMGMSPGWYDIYPWWRADQYVEVSGLPDGVYELVSVINPTASLHETTQDNNEASTVFRLAGDQIEMLEMRTQADVGAHPDAEWDSGS